LIAAGFSDEAAFAGLLDEESPADPELDLMVPDLSEAEETVLPGE